jgi:glutaredoxin
VPTITLYGKPDCHLCDEALAAVKRVTARRSVTIEEVDITLDDDLHARYLERIPVVVLDGEELFHYHVDEAVLQTRLDRVAT